MMTMRRRSSGKAPPHHGPIGDTAPVHWAAQRGVSSERRLEVFDHQSPGHHGEPEQVSLEGRPVVLFAALCDSKQRSQRERTAIPGTAGDTTIMVNAKAADEMKGAR